MEEELSEMEKIAQERLAKIGATLTKSRFIGQYRFTDIHSYPIAYTIEYKGHSIAAPTLDLALITMIEHLAKQA